MPVNSKQNLIIRLGVIVLVFTMLLTVFVGGTYAKYTTMVSGTDSARVAAFYVEALGIENNSIQIFKTAYKGEGQNADQNTVEGDQNLVAPGTEGSFDLVVNYFMEVDSYCTFTFEEIQTPVNANIPIIYSVDDGNSWYDAPDLPAQIETDLNEFIGAGKGQKTFKILWKWAFEEDMQDAHQQSDEYDTDLGFDAQSEVTLNIKLNVSQID